MKNQKIEFILKKQKAGTLLKQNKIIQAPCFSEDRIYHNQNRDFFIPKTIDLSIKEKLNTYKLITKKDDIPHGGYAIVVFYVNVDNEKDTLHCKITNITNMGESARNRVLKEIKIFKLIEQNKTKYCKKIVDFIYENKENYKDNEYIYLYLEKMRIDLRKILLFQKTKERLTKKEGYKLIKLYKIWLLQILYSLECLHSLGIVYNDLKPGNLLISNDNKIIKLTDFNCITFKNSKKTGCGTASYRSPEQITSKKGYFNQKTDIWSFGVIAFELFTTFTSPYRISNVKKEIDEFTVKNKFNNEQNLKNLLLEHLYFTLSNKEINQLVQLISSCLRTDPEKRPIIKKLLKLPFFKSI